MVAPLFDLFELFGIYIIRTQSLQIGLQMVHICNTILILELIPSKETKMNPILI